MKFLLIIFALIFAVCARPQLFRPQGGPGLGVHIPGLGNFGLGGNVGGSNSNAVANSQSFNRPGLGLLGGAGSSNAAATANAFNAGGFIYSPWGGLGGQTGGSSANSVANSQNVAGK